MTSLEQFAAQNPRKSGYRSWMESLPADILEQIDESGEISSSQVVAWLKSLGYDEATHSKVDHWRRIRGRRPTNP
jgi:hypothetical protein